MRAFKKATLPLAKGGDGRANYFKAGCVIKGEKV
jgi:hypothetical protein